MPASYVVEPGDDQRSHFEPMNKSNLEEFPLIRPISNIDVRDRSDQWEFFKIRLVHGLKVAPLIITGLDNVRSRHSVQRVWPETLIDMGAGRSEERRVGKEC